MIESNLMRELLNASLETDDPTVDNLLRAIHNVIPFKMGSVWKINNRSKSVSLLSRINYSPNGNLKHEFVHKLEGSLIGQILKSEYKLFCDIPNVSEDSVGKNHLSKQRVQSLGLKRLVCIPIPCHDRKNDSLPLIDAIINIYLEDSIEFSTSLAQIIRDQFSLAISRNRLIQRERLTKDIIHIYEKKAQKDLSSVLFPIIHDILPQYIQYEGCSVFIWDPFFNRLTLSQTTGLKGKPLKTSVSYLLGEGLTGCIAEKKIKMVIDNLSELEQDYICNEYIHKYQEETRKPPQTFLGMPIMSPSRPDEVVGVIRFTNRLNKIENVIDFFCIDDCELVEHACRLIALYMDYEYSERVRLAFALQMAHELQTPAFSIRGTSDRLLKNRNTNVIHEEKQTKYLTDIFDQSSLQVALANSIIHLGKGSIGRTSKASYDISKCDVKMDVLIPSKKLVIPYARSQRLTFDNLQIVGNFPTLFVDKNAFQQVFFNLFTNAIKYRSKTFEVIVNCLGSDDYSNNLPGNFLKEKRNAKGYVIEVEDNGKGLNTKELKKIFLLGYRAIGQETHDVRGLGLGLTVVQSILNDFGCCIWVSNNKKPTKFSIFFPEKLLSVKYAYSSEWTSY